MEQVNIVVISQNVVLSSIKKILSSLDKRYRTVILSTQLIMDMEKELIEQCIDNCIFSSFSDFLTDVDMEICDSDAYKLENKELALYYSKIKELKNKKVIENVEKRYVANTKLILSNDLGIDIDVWKAAGYKEVLVEYYYTPTITKEKKKSKLSYQIDTVKNWLKIPIYVAKADGIKYIFYGKMHRIGYRINLNFRKRKIENILFICNYFMYKITKKAICRKNVLHMSTLHEVGQWKFPEIPSYKVGLIQDGYLPPNYSSLYLKFVGTNVKYYAWDKLGMQVFLNQNIPISLLPHRKKLYMPLPNFKEKIKTVLIVASGAGDWTALKNRSDEDRMVVAFANIAKQFPDIHFVYRCHPVWIHPEHQGVNSINRVADFFQYCSLSNLTLSGNIPATSLNNFQLSFSRNSLESDLEEADVVFGEHSVSMIDATFKNIPFASVNLTGRRNFFCGMTEMGFPNLENECEIVSFINAYGTENMRNDYSNAVKKYNEMTDCDK